MNWIAVSLISDTTTIYFSWWCWCAGHNWINTLTLFLFLSLSLCVSLFLSFPWFAKREFVWACRRKPSRGKKKRSRKWGAKIKKRPCAHSRRSIHHRKTHSLFISALPAQQSCSTIIQCARICIRIDLKAREPLSICIYRVCIYSDRNDAIIIELHIKDRRKREKWNILTFPHIRPEAYAEIIEFFRPNFF